MYKINQIGTDEFKVIVCGNGSLQLWFGQTLAHMFTDAKGYNEFVQTLQESIKVLGIEPKKPEITIPVGYYPGQSPLIGTMPNVYRPQITCQNSEGGTNGNT